MKNLFSMALAGLAMFALSGVASAQFVASNAGPINSFGPVGDPNNGFFFANNIGPTNILTRLNFNGELTSGGVGSFRSEARWNIQNTTRSTPNTNFQFATGGVWSGTVSVTASVGLFMFTDSGDQFRFEAFESFNDPGLDAIWTNVDFDFNTPATPTFLGVFGPSFTFDFDTGGSTFDTELGLYAADGTLIATNDDAPGFGLQSRINAGTLPIGTYYLIQSGFNSQYVNSLAIAGLASGNLSVQLNGSNVFSGFHNANEFTSFSFQVVPEPSSFVALAGVSVLGLTFRRRRTA